MLRWGALGLGGVLALGLLVIAVLTVVNPPTTHTIWSEGRRLGGVEQVWVDAEDIAPVMLRSVVAAEDANFCLHWGFDMAAIRLAIEEGGGRGASTLSQQVVKNVFLWQGRNWTRKAAEAAITPAVEAIWSKRRILEVYLNVAEFGEGLFGIEAAAQHYYGIAAANLSPRQAARLAVLLPNPKQRDPRNLSGTLMRRAGQIAEGAATIRADGRSACFES
jgi:monofunctional biosynthetic peptidoglycan transglycosylase